MEHRNFHMQEKSILMKIRVWSVCDDSCYAAATKTVSNHPTSMDIKQELKLVAFAAPDGAQEFSYARKIDFDENSRLERLRRQLLCCGHQNRLEQSDEHGNQAGVEIGCIRSSGWSTGIFICKKNRF